MRHKAIGNSKKYQLFRLALCVLLLTVSFPTEAQKAKKAYKIGILDPGSLSSREERWRPFRQKLRELGYVEERNTVFEYRYADSKPERLPVLAAQLVRLNVDVIVTSSTPPAFAAKNATASIPIVMEAGDPVGSGLVASLARPGGNVTGLSSLVRELGEKRLELLREILPKLSRTSELKLWTWRRNIDCQRSTETD